MSLSSGACHPETQVMDLVITEPDGSATSNIPDRALRIECVRSCVAAFCPREERTTSSKLLGRRACRTYGICAAFCGKITVKIVLRWRARGVRLSIII